MSLNIVDTLVDKLFFTLNGYENPLTRKFTASQSLLGSSRIYESIPSEFQQALFANEYVSPAYCIQNQSLTEKMFPFLPIEFPSQSLVNRVPKLISPPLAFTSDVFRDPSSAVKKSQDPELLFNQGLTALQEAIKHQTSIFKTVLSFTESLEKEMTADLIVQSACAVEVTTKSAASMPQDGMVAPQGATNQRNCQELDATEQKLQVDNSSLNQELANRKTKEIQKRSKKRRRRQKKRRAKSEKCTYSEKNDNIKPEPQNIKVDSSLAHPSRDTEPQSTEKANCDILCDMVSIGESSPNLQIRSFVIAVDSAGDDDSEWDNSSDVEFIADCTEFEFSGLFVGNLAPARNFSFTSCTSHVTVSPTHEEDPEVRKLAALLRKVNKDWHKANQDFCSNPKVASKVSFAVEDELVEVFEVEMYSRKGEWEMYACERLRFKKRINEVESILAPCLSKEHRNKVYRQLCKINL